MQHSLGARTVASISYVGNTNRFQNDYRNINLPPQAGSDSAHQWCRWRKLCHLRRALSGLPLHRPVDQRGQRVTITACRLDINSQVGKDLFLRAFYTYSKTMDPTTGGTGGGDLGNVSNPYLGWLYDKGPGGYDRTHNAVVNFIYDIPLFRHSDSRLLRTAVGGWQVSGIVTLVSGLPLNIGLSGAQGGNGLPNATNRPDLIGCGLVSFRR